MGRSRNNTPSIVLVGSPDSLPVRIAGRLGNFRTEVFADWPTSVGDMKAFAQARVVVGEVSEANYANLELFKRTFPTSLVVTVSGHSILSCKITDIHLNTIVTVDELAQVALCLARRTKPAGATGFIGEPQSLSSSRRVGDWTIYPPQFKARHRDGRELKMTGPSIRLLYLFLDSAEVAFSRTHLALSSGRASAKLKSRSLDQHLLLVRRIIGKVNFRYLGGGTYAYLPTGQIPLSPTTTRELSRKRWKP